AETGVVIGAQVKTRTGLERGAEQRLAFGVRPAFQVKFTCERANRDAACLPVAPMRLEFNAPVPREKAEGIRLKQARRWRGVEAPSIPGKMLRLQDEQSIVARYREFLSGWHQGNARPGERMALATADKAESFELPRAGGEKPMEVIGIPLKRPGFYVVELA